MNNCRTKIANSKRLKVEVVDIVEVFLLPLWEEGAKKIGIQRLLK
jgi:hypothetical protein